MDNAEPTRYRVADIQTQMTLGCGNGGILVTDPNGPIVAYGEYARLKAEVERLRKAGDDLAFRLKDISDEAGMAGFGSVERWNAAKEGKPS